MVLEVRPGIASLGGHSVSPQLTVWDRAPLRPWLFLTPQVLMAELLPLLSTQEPQGPRWLALCRAAHSLLCEGGERFLTILQDEPAD